jgi:hypothetical protein
MLDPRRREIMTECKHGLRHGCVYCHGRKTTPSTTRTPPAANRRSRSSRLSEQMNDRLTTLNRRLKQLRGQ